MGLTIEDIEQWARQNNYTIVTDNWWEAAQDTINKYQQLRADYENRLKADMIAMLSELKYDLYQELCKEIHGKEDCPCTNQTTSCLATFRVCDADSAINITIQQKIDKLKENKIENKKN